MPIEWEDVHIRVCKDDLYKGPGHRCISYKGVIYKPESDDQPDDCRKAFQKWISTGLIQESHKQILWMGWEAAWVSRKPERESGWQPIETAPKDGTVIIVPHSDFSGVYAIFWGTYKCAPEKEGWFLADGSDEAGLEYDCPGWISCPQKGWTNNV